ncbi:MAG: PQQ-like beta-propeller repeat protein [Planctomycetes bacterium]|nr:PQQ-like beta-propeller repeat protein [Planctomycetota bacterium]
MRSPRSQLPNKYLTLLFVASVPAVVSIPALTTSANGPQSTTEAPTTHLSPRFEKAVPTGTTLLAPNPSANAPVDYFLAHDGLHVHAYNQRNGNLRQTQPQEHPRTPRWVVTNANHFILANSFEVSGHHFGSRLPDWRIGTSPADIESVGADHESHNPIRYLLATDKYVIAVHESGLTQNVDQITGTTIWQRTLDPQPTGLPAVADATLTYVSRSESSQMLHILESQTGRAISTTILPTSPTILAQYPAASTTILLRSTGLLAIDTHTGKQKWQTRGEATPHVGQVTANMGTIYISVDGHQVVKLSRATGTQLWRFEGSTVGTSTSGALTVANDRVLLHNESFATVLNATDGHLLAHIPICSDETIQHAMILEDALIVVSRPKDPNSAWHLHRQPLRPRNAPTQPPTTFELQPFPKFKRLVTTTKMLILHDGQRIVGIPIPR